MLVVWIAPFSISLLFFPVSHSLSVFGVCVYMSNRYCVAVMNILPSLIVSIHIYIYVFCFVLFALLMYIFWWLHCRARCFQNKRSWHETARKEKIVMYSRLISPSISLRWCWQSFWTFFYLLFLCTASVPIIACRNHARLFSSLSRFYLRAFLLCTCVVCTAVSVCCKLLISMQILMMLCICRMHRLHVVFRPFSSFLYFVVVVVATYMTI